MPYAAPQAATNGDGYKGAHWLLKFLRKVLPIDLGQLHIVQAISNGGSGQRQKVVPLIFGQHICRAHGSIPLFTNAIRSALPLALCSVISTADCLESREMEKGDKKGKKEEPRKRSLSDHS
jgi:hypothetical protein